MPIPGGQVGKLIAGSAGLAAGAEYLVPLAKEHPAYAGAALLGLLGLAGTRTASRAVSESPRYKEEIINRVLHPERYQVTSPLLTAPTVEGINKRREQY